MTVISPGALDPGSADHLDPACPGRPVAPGDGAPAPAVPAVSGALPLAAAAVGAALRLSGRAAVGLGPTAVSCLACWYPPVTSSTAAVGECNVLLQGAVPVLAHLRCGF